MQLTERPDKPPNNEQQKRITGHKEIVPRQGKLLWATKTFILVFFWWKKSSNTYWLKSTKTLLLGFLLGKISTHIDPRLSELHSNDAFEVHHSFCNIVEMYIDWVNVHLIDWICTVYIKLKCKFDKNPKLFMQLLKDMFAVQLGEPVNYLQPPRDSPESNRPWNLFAHHLQFGFLLSTKHYL